MMNSEYSMTGCPARLEFGSFLSNSKDLQKRYGGKISPTELKNRAKEQLVIPYWNCTQGDEPGSGIQISFSEFLQTRPDGGPIFLGEKTGQPLGWPDIFDAMGEDPSRLLLNSLATMSGDLRLFLSLFISDSFIKGFSATSNNKKPLWSQMCFATGVPSQFDEYRRTWMQFIGEPTLTGEGETFPEARISLGTETGKLEKRGLTLKMSEEFIRSAPLPVIEHYLVQMGRTYQLLENNRCVDALLNGDLSSGGNAAPVIGVTDPTIGICYSDFLRCWNRGDMIGESFFNILTGEEMAFALGNIDEFRERQVGTPMVTLANGSEPSKITRFVSSQIPDHQVVLVDTSHALRQRVFIPLKIDKSFKPENWENGVTIGYYTGFERVGDKAVVVLDETKSFADNGWPSWFTINGVRS